MSRHIGYHFLRADMTAASGKEPAWAIGETRRLTGTIEICSHGYHASPSPWDALQYAQGPVLCVVELSGVTKANTHGDKWAGRTRKLIKAVNVERELHELACQFAESVLHIYEKRVPGDMRPRQAIEAKRKRLRGEISDRELAAASDAASDVAWAAAWDAASDAAWDAASDAAWDAAWDAASDVAWAAAWAAASDAAWDAARAAAWAAAWAAARAAASDVAWAAALKEYADLTNRVLIGALEAVEVTA